MKGELKPCPFCGSEAEICGSQPDNYYVKCRSCDASSTNGYRSFVIERWNTRSLIPGGEAGLRETLRRIADGDEPRPLGKSYFPDKRPSKHDQCTHGIWMYETCGNCVMNFARDALAALTPITPDGGELLAALKELCLSAECAAGVDEGASEDVAASEIMSSMGSAMAVSYEKARALIAKAARP